MQTKPQACAFVGHTFDMHSLLFLKVEPLLHEQSKAPHSPAIVHASPGCFGPGAPASGVGVAVPAHPPCVLHADGHTAPAVPHAPPEQVEAVIGFLPSLHAHTTGAQSTALVQRQPPRLAQAFGQTCSGSGEQ